MSRVMTLTAKRVEAIFKDCLFKKGEDTSKHIKAMGVVGNVRFHPERLKIHEAEIVAMLDELPNEFKETGGGGTSFLNAAIDKHGNQWASFHQQIEQLFQLGIGLGKVRSLIPRKLWYTLPGEMPCYVITV